MKNKFLKLSVVFISIFCLTGCSESSEKIKVTMNNTSIEESINDNSISETEIENSENIVDESKQESGVENVSVEETPESITSFLAKVTSINKDKNLVTVIPLDGQNELEISDKFIFDMGDLENKDIIETDCYLKIFYDGTVATSFPVQINVQFIEIIYEENLKIEENNVNNQNKDTNNYYFNGEVEVEMKPVLMLNDETGIFQFFYDSYSSYFPYGSYEINNGKIICSTEDGLYKFIFNIIDENTISLNLEESSSILEDDFSKCLENKAIFKK